MSLHPSSSTDPLQWLDSLARGEPERLLIETVSGAQLTYGEMAQLSKQLAQALAARSVVPGERVVAQVEKSVEAMALYLACLRLGAVFVPLNTAYTLAEMHYFLTDAAPRVAVVRPADAEAIATPGAGIAIETLDATGGGSLIALAQSLPLAHVADFPAEPASLAALLYTSGTTGRSKGAMLSRANLASNAQTLVAAWRFTAQDVLLHALPIFHVHGLFVAINTVLASGSSMLFLPKFDADTIIELLPRATVLMGVPTFYTRLLQHAGLTRERVRRMRLFISGSAPLLPDTHRDFRERTGHAILERYGMSETLMNTSNPYDGERIAGSVGPPLAGVEVRITDAESGVPLDAPNAIGMIEVRGPNVFSGYWRMPEKTAAEFRSDGFFITGDLGRIDPRGYVHIVGRGKDLIISGGYNVYPIEVETEIDALPGVLESAVIGLPHADLGEAVTAMVVPAQRAAENGRSPASLEPQALLRALQTRLAKFKLPKRVVLLTELPRNTMGKVQKSVLREQYRDLYGNHPQ
jgi:malonyl-CoA/methylmalonyl-CoA synthetase